MAMTREQSQAASLARARRRRAEAEQNPGFFGKVDAAMRGVADGLTLGFSDEISAGLGAATGIGGTFGDYYGNLEAQRARDERDGRTSGGTRLVGQLAGSVALPIGAARNGLTLVQGGGGLARRGLQFAKEGAAYGALAGAGNATEGNRLSGAMGGAAFGAGVGVAAPVAISGVTLAARPITNAVRNATGPALSQAGNRIGMQLRAAGLDDASIQARLSDLGQDAALVDVMGARGQALARAASNTSPDARATLEGFTAPRQALQPERVVASLEEASGLPSGNRRSVDGLKEAAYSRAAPEINRTYAAARQAGFDLPLEAFETIMSSPMGKRELGRALQSVRNREAAGQASSGSNLTLLDQMKRGLDSQASKAARAGDNDTASQATALARVLREQMDELLQGGEYAAARGLRQAAYQTDEAFDAGAELAGRRVGLDTTTKVRGGVGVQGPIRPEVGQGYAAALSEEILNRRGTPDALNRLSAPMQQEAMDTALQGGAERVRQQLARERIFGETHRALTGNSSTARQLAEMGATAGAGAGLGLLGGFDPTSAGMAGIAAALTRRGATSAVNAIRSGNEEAVSREIAKLLVARGVPTTPSGVSVALRNPQQARSIARLLAATGGAQAGSTGAQ